MLDSETQGFIQDSVSRAVTEAQGSLLGNLDQLISSKLERFQDKISENQKTLADNQISKIKNNILSDGYSFKRKSCEDQYKFNAKVLDKLQDAETCLDEGAGIAAKDKVSEGKELINHRQKLIRIADEAEMGWKVVKEYDTNPLADDSDDERRIYRAESRANRKAKAEKAKRSKTRFNPYSYRQRPTATVTIPSGQPVDNYGDRAAKPGLCFLCHKPGHWKNTCELAKGAAGKNNKLSTNCFESNSLVASDNATVGSGSQHEYEALHTTLVENDCSSSPIGRLKAAESKWRQAGANAYIMRVILEGYSIPFRELPTAKQMKNNKSARDNMQFVISEVSKLLEKQCVTEVFEKPKVINPLTVAFSKTGKKRLVLDCRHINEYLVKYKFKYEDINTATQMFRKGSYLFSYDLKSAYHHIMIQNEMRTYLGFSVEHEGVEKYYVFNVLPFGLATSGHIFTKVLRVLIAYWRGQGHKVIMFLDDGIGGHLNFDEATKLSQLVQSGLTEFGFLLASDKCQWMPVTKLPWLGYLLDMAMGKLFVTDERISRLEIAIESFLYQMKVSGSSVMKVRFIASLVGQIISLQTVVGKLVSMRTRALYWCILSRASWNAPVVVTSEAIEELEFWLKNARALNMKGRFLEENIDCEIEVFCDASAAGYGGYFIEKDIAEIIDGSCVNVAHGCDLNTDDNCLSEAMRAKNANCSGESIVAKCVTCVDENACNEAVKVQASSIRMGPVAEECDHEITGSWSIEEADKSSTWREAETVKRVLASNVGAFRAIIQSFSRIDENGDGKISKRELARAYRLAGFNPTNEEIDTLLKEHDVNGDGYIDFEEYFTGMKSRLSDLDMEKERMKAAFKVLDFDQDGYITSEELERALNCHCNDFTHEDIEDIMATADKNNDGRIDYNEFVDSHLCQRIF